MDERRTEHGQHFIEERRGMDLVGLVFLFLVSGAVGFFMGLLL